MGAMDLIKLPKGKVGEVIKKYQSKDGQLARLKDKMKTETNALIHTGEVAGAAFLMGLAHNKYGYEKEIVGVPVALGVGVLTKALALSGMAGKDAGRHLNAIGDGCLAVEAYIKGRQVALKDKDAKAKPFQGLDDIPEIDPSL
jgi:hypothetical protein